jgi:tRNA(Arg) A34 adenosine deaminase TadA
VDLEEELQKLSVGDSGGIEDDLDRFGMGAVIALGRVGHIAARVANPRRHDAIITAHKVLHAPEAAAGKNGTFLGHGIFSTCSR